MRSLLSQFWQELCNDCWNWCRHRRCDSSFPVSTGSSKLSWDRRKNYQLKPLLLILVQLTILPIPWLAESKFVVDLTGNLTQHPTLSVLGGGPSDWNSAQFCYYQVAGTWCWMLLPSFILATDRAKYTAALGKRLPGKKIYSILARRSYLSRNQRWQNSLTVVTDMVDSRSLISFSYATGRKPNTAGPGLKTQTFKSLIVGAIQVNRHWKPAFLVSLCSWGCQWWVLTPPTCWWLPVSHVFSTTLQAMKYKIWNSVVKLCDNTLYSFSTCPSQLDWARSTRQRTSSWAARPVVRRTRQCRLEVLKPWFATRNQRNSYVDALWRSWYKSSNLITMAMDNKIPCIYIAKQILPTQPCRKF